MTDGPSAPAEAPQRSLDKSLIRGIGWTGGMRWFVQIVSWTATLVIARLLTPAEYGLVGMAVVYSGFVEMVSDFGLGAAIVQRRALDADRVARIGGFAALLGLALFGISLLLAEPIAAFYGEPAVAGIISVLAINYVLAGIQFLPQSLLVRELRFRQLAWLRGTEAFSLTAWTITLALLHAGYWALVFGLVASKFTAMILALIWRRHRIAWPFPLKPIASEISFGWQYMVSNVAWYLYTTADVAVVGRFLGKVVLGTYSIAWNLASVPVERIAAPLGDVFRGIFSAVQTDRRALARYLCALTEGLAIATFPLSVGLALVAGDCIPVLLGDQWGGAVQPLRWIALYAMVRAVATLFAPILVATGHTRENMRIHVVGAVAMPLLFVAGTHWGMIGVAAAGLVGYTTVVVSLSLKEVLGIVEVSFGRYLRSLVPAVIGTLVMTAAVVPVQRYGPAVPGTLGHLLLEVAAGGVVYIATISLIRGRRLLAMLQLLRDVRKGSPTTASPRLLLEERESVRGTPRRLLVITYHYPPDGAVGGLRWAALGRYLKTLGWDVSVLTAATGLPRDGRDRPEVFSTPRARTIIDLYRRFVLRRNLDAAVASEAPPQRGILRSELTAALALPDESRGWTLRAAWRARRIIRSFHPSVVVSSGPPHSAHVVARLATAGTGVRWIADLRDPWPQMLSDVKQWDPVQGTRLARLIMPLLERAVMPAADGIIANTEILATRLAERHAPIPVVWVRNGFDPDRCPPASTARGSTFAIRYAGSVYGGRSLRPALEALRQFIDRASLAPYAIRLEIAGQAHEPYRSRLLSNISQLQLTEYVTVVGPLPGTEALQRLRDSDLSLVLAQGQSLQVPAKLYESLGMGVRTLVLADSGSATAREAAQLGAIVAHPDDIATMVQVLERVYHGTIGAPRQPDGEILYPVIAERLHRMLEDPAVFADGAVNPAAARPGHPALDLAASLTRSEAE